MVVRIPKKSRKYLGNRRWGAGNIKNNRGSGDRGGVGKAGRKHKWTYIVKYAPDTIGKKGFARVKVRMKEVNLDYINEKFGNEKEVNLYGYKVLGGGNLSKPLIIKASDFSRIALEKIKKVGGEAVKV